jgi:Flp pilus assembly protein TadG
MIRRKSNNARGSFLADGPLIIWLVFLFLFLPLLDFSAALLRSTFLYMAVHNAARNAAKSRSFLNPIGSDPSATQIASNTVTNVASMWSGVKVNSILAEIVTTNLDTQTVSRQANPLTTPADDSNNTYQIEVTVTGSVDPLVTFNMPWIGNGGVPGLTKPMAVTMIDRQYVENPQGLVL